MTGDTNAGFAAAIEAAARWEWHPRVGEPVTPTESFLSMYGEWRDLTLYVTGVRVAKSGGLEISVNDDWPLTSRSSGDTDGFYIGRDHTPDDLRALTPPTDAAPVEAVERAAKIVERFRPKGPYAKHFVDVLVCDIAAAIRKEMSNA